jgi:parvulin-like peptidyl-prolyl isomerase
MIELASARRWYRWPAVHFAAIGLVLLAITHGTTTRDDRQVALVITAPQVEALRATFAEEMGRQPTPAEQDALVRQAIDDELLYREARARGLDVADRSVGFRVLQKMQALREGDEAHAPSPEAMVAEGFALGFDDDAIVRRMLVEKMRLLLASGDEQPDEAVLRDHFERHADEYRQPPRRTLRHVFLSTEAHGHDLDAAAQRLHERLAALGADASEVASLGDRFPFGARFERHSERDLARVVGPDCAHTILGLEPGRWQGPLSSPFGRHLVWVEAVEPSALPPFEAVRGRVAESWRTERRPARIEAALRELRARYAVLVEDASGEAHTS